VARPVPDPHEEIERQVDATAALVAERLHLGDRVDVPREVEHQAYFWTTGRAEAAMPDLQSLGYRIGTVERRGLRVAVAFSRTDAVDGDTAAAFTREVVAVVLRHRGRYDGWGAYLAQGSGAGG
jgi:regulator of RNase E activity RraB